MLARAGERWGGGAPGGRGAPPDVDQPSELLLDVQRHRGQLDPRRVVGGLASFGPDRLHDPANARQPDLDVGVEPPRGRVGLRQDLLRPFPELTSIGSAPVPRPGNLSARTTRAPFITKSTPVNTERSPRSWPGTATRSARRPGRSSPRVLPPQQLGRDERGRADRLHRRHPVPNHVGKLQRVRPVRVDAAVRAERQLHAGRDGAAEALALRLRRVVVLLQGLGRPSLAAPLLGDVVAVVDVGPDMCWCSRSAQMASSSISDPCSIDRTRSDGHLDPRPWGMGGGEADRRPRRPRESRSR